MVTRSHCLGTYKQENFLFTPLKMLSLSPPAVHFISLSLSFGFQRVSSLTSRGWGREDILSFPSCNISVLDIQTGGSLRVCLLESNKATLT
jgi:hypothetical protein